jgi:AP-4 complex subunit epsilon-1
MVNNMLEDTLSTLHKTPRKTPWLILRILQTIFTLRSGKLSYIISFSNTLTDFLNEISPSGLISCELFQRTLVIQVCLPRILLQIYKVRLFCIGIILGIFRNFSLLSPEMLLSKEKSQGISAIRCIKGLLTSQNPNNQYLFLSCLESLDPMVWAGTTEEYSAVLDAFEVGRVMEFLDAPDHLMRKKVGPKVTLSNLQHR